MDLRLDLRGEVGMGGWNEEDGVPFLLYRLYTFDVECDDDSD
jgi:hypothetical protein